MATKIIQIVATPADIVNQGLFLGLGDDGVVYMSSEQGWVVHTPANFYIEEEE